MVGKVLDASLSRTVIRRARATLDVGLGNNKERWHQPPNTVTVTVTSIIFHDVSPTNERHELLRQRP